MCFSLSIKLDIMCFIKDKSIVAKNAYLLEIKLLGPMRHYNYCPEICANEGKNKHYAKVQFQFV